MTKEQAKQIKIVDYLAKKGIKPVVETAKSFVYLSPFREESTPSFHVLKNSNFFKDFGSETKAGDIINLVMALDNINFSEALKKLSGMNITPAQDFFSYEPKQSIKVKSHIVYKQPITNNNLIAYLHQRGISQKIYQYQENLFQANYTFKSKNGNEISCYNLAWKNDLNGYDLRGTQTTKEKRFISMDGQKHFTTIEGTGYDLNIFEGFFDYLSALEYYSAIKLKNTTIVLNTLSSIPSLTDIFKNSNQINLFLDNDEAGKKAAEKLMKNFENCINRSVEIYPSHKDFNEFLMNLKSL